MTSDQLDPLFVERKIHSQMYQRKVLVPLKAKDCTIELGSPVLTSLQLDPLLVDRNILPAVPAKIFDSLTAKENDLTTFRAICFNPLSKTYLYCKQREKKEEIYISQNYTPF